MSKSPVRIDTIIHYDDGSKEIINGLLPNIDPKSNPTQYQHTHSIVPSPALGTLVAIKTSYEVLDKGKGMNT